jgi:NNP family nitrate/nitrite transporter-like MFS transporter
VSDRSTASSRRTEEPWGLLAGLLLLWLFLGAYAIVPASVLPVVTRKLAVGPAAVSLIVTAPQVGAAVAGLPVGAWLDRTDNTRAIVLAGLWLFATSVFGWLAGARGLYWPLVAARLLGGVSLVTVWVAGTNLLSAAFGPRYRTTVVAAYTAGYPAGYALGQFGAPIVTTRLGWPATFPVFGALTAAVLPACYLAGRRVARARATGLNATFGDVAAVATNRQVWLVCLASFAVYSVYLVLNGWLPTYMVGAFGLSLAETGRFVAVFPAIGIVARTGGGVLSDRVFDRRKRPVVMLSFIVTTLVVVALAALGGRGVLIPFLVGLIAAGFVVQLQIGVLYTYVQAFVPPETTASAVSLVAVAGWVGQFLAPAVTGAFVSLTGSDTAILGCAVAFGLLGTVVGRFAPDG